MASVKCDLFDPSRDRLLRQQLADRLGGSLVAAIGHVRSHILVLRADSHQRLAAAIVDNLARQIAVTAKNRKARPTGRAANAFPHAELPPLPLVSQILAFVHCFVLAALSLPVIGGRTANDQ